MAMYCWATLGVANIGRRRGGEMAAFYPTGATLSATFTSSSTQITLPAPSGAAPALRIANEGPSAAFLEFGANPTATTSASMPMLPGSVELFDHPGSGLKVAGI